MCQRARSRNPQQAPRPERWSSRPISDARALRRREAREPSPYACQTRSRVGRQSSVRAFDGEAVVDFDSVDLGSPLRRCRSLVVRARPQRGDFRIVRAGRYRAGPSHAHKSAIWGVSGCVARSQGKFNLSVSGRMMALCCQPRYWAERPPGNGLTSPGGRARALRATGGRRPADRAGVRSSASRFRFGRGPLHERGLTWRLSSDRPHSDGMSRSQVPAGSALTSMYIRSMTIPATDCGGEVARESRSTMRSCQSTHVPS